VRVLEVTSLSVVLHLSVSVSAARNTTRLANKSLRVPRKKVRDELRARGLRANFAHLITRNYLYWDIDNWLFWFNILNSCIFAMFVTFNNLSTLPHLPILLASFHTLHTSHGFTIPIQAGHPVFIRRAYRAKASTRRRDGVRRLSNWFGEIRRNNNIYHECWINFIRPHISDKPDIIIHLTLLSAQSARRAPINSVSW